MQVYLRHSCTAHPELHKKQYPVRCLCSDLHLACKCRNDLVPNIVMTWRGVIVELTGLPACYMLCPQSCVARGLLSTPLPPGKRVFTSASQGQGSIGFVPGRLEEVSFKNPCYIILMRDAVCINRLNTWEPTGVARIMSSVLVCCTVLLVSCCS